MMPLQPTGAASGGCRPIGNIANLSTSVIGYGLIGYNGSNVAGYIVYKAKAEADKYKARDYLRSIFGEEAPEPTSSYDLSDVHIFLPAAGFRADKGEETGLFKAGSGGFYWSSTRSSQDSHDAYGLGFISDRMWVGDGKPDDLSIGKPVRAVCK